MADVTVHTSENGDVHVGFVSEAGTFIPFANVGAARIAQLDQRAASLRELADSDDAEAVKRHDEAAAALPYDAKASSKSASKSSTKGGES